MTGACGRALSGVTDGKAVGFTAGADEAILVNGGSKILSLTAVMDDVSFASRGVAGVGSVACGKGEPFKRDGRSRGRGSTFMLFSAGVSMSMPKSSGRGGILSEGIDLADGEGSVHDDEHVVDK